jgi:hypothetical protein
MRIGAIDTDAADSIYVGGGLLRGLESKARTFYYARSK